MLLLSFYILFLFRCVSPVLPYYDIARAPFEKTKQREYGPSTTFHGRPQNIDNIPSTPTHRCIYPFRVKPALLTGPTRATEPRRQKTARLVQPHTCRTRRVLRSIGCHPSRLFLFRSRFPFRLSSLVCPTQYSLSPSLSFLPYRCRGTARGAQCSH